MGIRKKNPSILGTLVYRTKGLSAKSPWLKHSILAANLGLSRAHVLGWFAAHTEHSDGFSGTGNGRVLFFFPSRALWHLAALPCMRQLLSPRVIHCWHQIATSANGQVACVLLVLVIKYLTTSSCQWKSLASHQTLCLQGPLLPLKNQWLARHLSPSKH